jgi:type II secretion system protein I
VKQQSRHGLPQGVTLLEVLVAMTIVGLGVVTVLQVFSSGLRLQARSTDRSDAMVAGARVMDELLARRNLQEGSESGKLGGDGRWTSQVQSMRDAPSSLGLSGRWELKEVAVEMTVFDGAGERRMELKTLRLDRKDRR